MLRRALTGPCRLPPGATLLVAVSGGADSTALLAALVSLAREHALVLHAAHLDHGLRGRDSAADRTHVRALCARLGVPLSDARWDCAARMRRRGLRGEAGLRTLRHEWLTSVARRLRAAGIATAHTADDQLETLLLRLGRGTGLTGAAGMRARRGLWLKPLLEATRADLEADLRHAGLAWRDDASNATLALAGDFDPETARAWIVKYFGGLSGPKKPASPRAVTAPVKGPVRREVEGAADRNPEHEHEHTIRLHLAILRVARGWFAAPRAEALPPPRSRQGTSSSAIVTDHRRRVHLSSDG